MKIFSEIYGAYFRTAEEVLSRESVTEREIYKIISEKAFRDSLLFIPEKLIPSDGGSPWGLLRKTRDGYSPAVKNKPPKIVTELQKRWIKAKLSDPKMRLFMEDADLCRLSERLKDVKPLYRAEFFRFFDMFADGDDFEDENYRKNFRTVLSAAKRREVVSISFNSRAGEGKNGEYLPLKIQYSKKNNKFRAYCLNIKDGQSCGGSIINFGRITGARLTGRIWTEETDTDSFFSQMRCDAPAEVTIRPERNGVERFMTEFAAYEKQSTIDLKTGKCTARIWYDRQDETELLVQLLSFGPVLLNKLSGTRKQPRLLTMQMPIIRNTAILGYFKGSSVPQN